MPARGRNLILAYGRKSFPNRRPHELIEQDVDQQREASDKVEKRLETPKTNWWQPRNRNRRRRSNAVNTERPLRQTDPVEQDLIGDDGKTERCNCQIVSAQAHGKQRQKHSRKSRKHDTSDEGAPEGHAELCDEEGRNIGAKTVKRRMTEVELTRIAEDEIKTKRQQNIDRTKRQIGAPVRGGK